MSAIGVKPEPKENGIGERKGNQGKTNGIDMMIPMKREKLQAVPVAVQRHHLAWTQALMDHPMTKGLWLLEQEKIRKKLKSGISEKSHCADIEWKCKWPSLMLDGIFEDEILFKSLTVAQFLYRELCIWERPKTKPNEIKARQYLLKKCSKMSQN